MHEFCKNHDYFNDEPYLINLNGFRIFDDGMGSVNVTDVEESSGFYGISNMIVHENYRTEDQSEMHDVGQTT